MVRRPLRRSNTEYDEPVSSSSSPELFWYVRVTILAMAVMAMLVLDYETIGGFGLEGIIDIKKNKRENKNHSAHDESSAMAPSLVTLVKEKFKSEQTQEPVLVESQTLMTAAPKPDTTLHSTQTGILDLVDWEQESLEGITNIADTIDWSSHPRILETTKPAETSCNPPNGISKECCLGSFSGGSMVTEKYRWQCAASLQPQAMEELKEGVRRFYRDNPLPDNDDKAMQCDLCQIVELAHQRSLNIALMGDSMHSQIAQGLDCELERRHYKVQTEIIPYKWNKPVDPKRRHISSKLFTVSSPTWPPGHAVNISFHMIYKAPLCEGCGDLLRLTANADVVVLGFGLHWWNGPEVAGKPDSRQEGYVKNMAQVFQMIRAQGHVQLLVHRETSAQHFDGDGGGFEFWWPNKNHSSPPPECKSFSMDDASVYWREKSIRKSAQQVGLTVTLAGPNMPALNGNNLTEIVSLPYFHFTAGFPLMHPKNYKPEEKMMDCTHYCGSPFMYYPLWRSLRFAMDRRYPSSPETATRPTRR